MLGRMEKHPTLIYDKKLAGCVSVNDSAPRVKVKLTLTATGDEEEKDGVTLSLDGRHEKRDIGVSVYFKDAKSWRKFVSDVEEALHARE